MDTSTFLNRCCATAFGHCPQLSEVAWEYLTNGVPRSGVYEGDGTGPV
jgi:hypothetical protein